MTKHKNKRHSPPRVNPKVPGDPAPKPPLKTDRVLVDRVEYATLVALRDETHTKLVLDHARAVETNVALTTQLANTNRVLDGRNADLVRALAALADVYNFMRKEGGWMSPANQSKLTAAGEVLKRHGWHDTHTNEKEP